MNPPPIPLLRKLHALTLLTAGIVASSLNSLAYPIITNVVETGGDNEATDTIVAKWTGVTYNTTVANEPLLATPVGTPFTVPLFGENAPCMVDRAHRWNSVSATVPMPSYLVGGEYIMIGNDNRDNANFRLDVSLSEPCLVYILIDCRLTDGSNADPPEGNLPLDQWTRMTWLAAQGFTPVLTGNNRAGDPSWPDEVGYDENSDGSINNYAAVYFKEVTTGSFYTGPYGQGQNMYGVVVKRQPNSVNNPPQITSLSPTNNAMFAPAAPGLTFSLVTISPNSIAPAGIKLSLNGTDVSSTLVITGSTTSRNVAYNSLQPNAVYNARITAVDQAGRGMTNTFTFDTFASNLMAIEAEDYNHGSGQFQPNPTPASYTGLAGVRDVDFHNNNGTATAPDTAYRPGEFVAFTTGTDQARAAFTDIGATDSQVTALLAGDWLNYTRNIAAGSYNIYLRAASGAPQVIRLDQVAGATTTTQTTSALGVFISPGALGTGYIPLTDAAGSLVTATLGGDTTLRITPLTANANLQLNYLLLVPFTGAAQPAYVAATWPIAGSTTASPDAPILVQINQGSKSVSPGAVHLVVDGTEVTSSATIASTATGVSLAYAPSSLLAGGIAHQVQVAFTDTDGGAYAPSWNFTVAAALPVIPANFGTAPGTGRDPGLNVRIRKAPDYNAGGTAFTLPNTAARANTQLADQLIDPDTTLPYVNEAGGPNGDGKATTGVVNFNQTGGPAAFFAGDEGFPYLDPAVFADPNNIAVEFTAYVELTAGIHRFGVRSDDGFRLTVGPTFVESSQLLGVFEGGRGSGLPGGSTEFDVQVLASGVYPLRLIYYEGNGGADLEFYSVDKVTFQRTLINQPGSAAALKAYTARSVEIHVPTIALTAPTAGQLFPAGPASITVSANASVVGGTIARVEFYQRDGYFQAWTKVGEAASAPFQVVLPAVGLGPHFYRAKATDHAGLTATTPAVEIRVGQATKVNFQQTVDVVPEGYLPDIGDVFGDRGNGFVYGWDLDNTANSRNRNNAGSLDERFDTFNHLQKPQPAGSLWEIELPNGQYYVFAVCGESDNFDSTFDLTAEGTTIVSGSANTDSRWIEGSGVVAVSDGRLSLGNGPKASNNKICFVEIYVAPAPAEPPAMAITRSAGQVTVTWTNGGTLYTAPAATGSWTSTGNSSGTHTESIETTKFFKVQR